MARKKLPNWFKGLLVGVGVDAVGYFLLPILMFLGFFGSWLNFEQYSLMWFATNIAGNYLLTSVIVLTFSTLVGLLFDLKEKKKKILVSFAMILAIILIVEIFAFGYSWKHSELYQTWGTLQDCPEMKRIEAKDSCYFNFAVEDDDPSLCYKLSDGYGGEIIECLASVNRDSSYCNNYSNEDDRNSCFESMSIDLLDRSLCDKVSNLERKTYCFRAFDGYISINDIKIGK